MSVQIQPAICGIQEAYDYLNITAAQAAATLPNGVTTLATFIQRQLNRSAAAIVAEINYDYTTAQVQQERFFGNGTDVIRLTYPVGTVTLFKSWDPDNPTALPVDIGGAQLSILQIDPFVLYRNDGHVFDGCLEYLIETTQALDLLEPVAWPEAIKEVQLEMVAQMYRSSWNVSAVPGDTKFRLDFIKRLRAFKRFAA